MNLQEVKNRIAVAKYVDEAMTHQEIEALCEFVISMLPHTEESVKEVIWSYKWLINRKMEEGRMARAMRLFKRYLNDGAPACDPAYDALYQDGLLATHTSPVPLERRERFYSLATLFSEILPLQGLVAECGCYRGLSSYLLCSFLKRADGKFDGRGYRIFDSFAGLSVPQPEDSVEELDPDAKRLKAMAQPGSFAASLDQVRGALAAFPEIEFFPGWIPHMFPDEPDARYRFVHVDVDIYQPTRDSIAYFYPRLVPGGMIVCDDYNWPGARKAIEEVCAQNSAEFKTTSHTQAYIVRRP
jgi:O-methyltransferase